jgi:hypothetical protein
VGGLPKMVVYTGNCPHLLLLFPDLWKFNLLDRRITDLGYLQLL